MKHSTSIDEQTSFSQQTSSSNQQARIFISYRSAGVDEKLARNLFDDLAEAGHAPFMAGASIQIGQNWSEQIDSELECCDYFLLLLSPESASSEMVTEEVRRAKQLRDRREDRRPGILPIRLRFPMDTELNYDLRGYLNRIQQAKWESPADTPTVVQAILDVIAAEGMPRDIPKGEEPVVSARPAFEGPLGCPLPVAEPEIPGGQMELASKFYIERSPFETRGKRAIEHPAGLVRIKAPRQMGKTSLLARILHHAKQRDYCTASISFQLMEERTQQNSDRFFLRFCALVSRELNLPTEQLKRYWDNNADLFGPMDCCTAYFEKSILPSVDRPFVLALDEVDKLFPYNDVAADFLALLRAWNEKAKNGGIWSKLRIVFVHATESYVAIDPNQSPFNVGLEIELPEFSEPQLMTLAGLHGLQWKNREVTQLKDMVGGHPYLIRLGLYHIAQNDMTLEQLLEEAPTEAGIYGDHLRRHAWHLEKHSDLLSAMKLATFEDGPVNVLSDSAVKLRGMGLVNLDGNAIDLRCQIYRQYFRERLQAS